MPGEEVSVRELRQNLSVHLRRVQEGATLAVTSRGTRVAMLAPIAGARRLDRLVAEGRVSIPAQPWGDLEAPPRADPRRESVTQALLEQRDEESR